MGQELILGPATNATAKGTAIRTLRELQDSGAVDERPSGFAELYRCLRSVGGRRVPSAV
ncbi:MAG: hypothetical protein ABWY97_00645 [Thermoleophilaceae bacterium]